MSAAPTMTFPFENVLDAHGLRTYRPVIPLRPMGGPADRFEQCLVDTGSPNTYLDWQLASLAGVDLRSAEKIPEPQNWSVGGVPAEALWVAGAALMIPEGRHMIRLGDVSVIFVRPWKHPDFAAVLGTDGMKRIGLIVDAGAGNGQLTIVQR